MTVYSRSRSTSTPSTGPTSVFIEGQSRMKYGDEPHDISYESTYMSPSRGWSMSDNPTPGYTRLSSQGHIINTNMVMAETIYTPPQPTYFRNELAYSQDGDDGPQDIGYWWGGPRAPSDSQIGGFLTQVMPVSEQADLDTAIAAAVTQAHANASVLELQTPVIAGELNKTISSLTSISGRVYKILKAMKRLDFQYLRKQISKEELQDRYMELRYALRPLMYDMKGLTVALNTKADTGFRRQTARSFKKHTYKDSSTSVLNMTDATGVRTCEVTINSEIRAGVLCDVRASTFGTYGFDSVFETAWELVPFSFIVDWFCNVGDTIAAWTPNYGVNELASWVVVKQNTLLRNSLGSFTSKRDSSFYNSKNTITWSGEASKSHTTVQRIASPSLSFWPRFQVSLNSLKLLDLAIIGRKLL